MFEHHSESLSYLCTFPFLSAKLVEYSHVPAVKQYSPFTNNNKEGITIQMAKRVFLLTKFNFQGEQK
jgi:hypothetical protein